ncbi:MAG: SHOCT domain-containing protein [Cellulomonas sp.]
MMGWYGNGMNGGGWVFMGLFWIALIALTVWLVLRLLPSKGKPSVTGTGSAPWPATPGQESPFEILDRRLALGDIDGETYHAHRAALTAARGGNR